MTRATPTRPVSFDYPPRVGHLPGVMDGREYAEGWRVRKLHGPRGENQNGRGTPSWEAGYLDADNAIRLGRDIGQRSEP